MNDKIKQLAGIALDETVPQTWTMLTAYDLAQFTEKFAELIVRECADIARQYDEPKMSGPGMIIAGRIETQFGVDQ